MTNPRRAVPNPRRTVPLLPAQGRRAAFIGKGGAGKSTVLAYCLRYWNSYGVPCVAIDTDVPGEGEHGTLDVHANAVDLGAPVYPAPAAHQIRQEARRLCPEKGVCVLDTGAWEKRQDGPHLTVMSAVDKVFLFLQPTPNEVERAHIRARLHPDAGGTPAPRPPNCTSS